MSEKLKLRDVQALNVYNIMETVVEDNFPTLIEKFPDSCHCRQCLSDIKALALNKLKPHYVASDKGSIYERVNLSGMMSKIEIIRAMTEAAEVVSKSPHHDVKPLDR